MSQSAREELNSFCKNGLSPCVPCSRLHTTFSTWLDKDMHLRPARDLKPEYVEPMALKYCVEFTSNDIYKFLIPEEQSESGIVSPLR